MLDMGIVARVEARPSAVSRLPGAEMVAASSETASEIKLGWGGYRPGAGRPRGSRTRKRPAELLAIGPRWYCVETHARAELAAEQDLTDAGFDAFCPIERRVVVRRGKRETVDRPFFPRYLFVRLDLADPAWRNAAHCEGVRRIFGRPERPTPLPEGAVEAWLVRTREGAVDGTPQALRLAAIQVGARVRLIEGPLANVEAIVQMSDERRVELLHTALGLIKAPREAVEEV